MNISYISLHDPHDVHGWSGLPYYINKAMIEQGNQMDYIYPLEFRTDNLLVRLKKKLYRRFSRNVYTLEREPVIARQFARSIESRLKPNTDILFSPGSIPLSMLEKKIPKVFYTDATFSGMLGYYDSLSNLCRESVRNGNRLEQYALERSTLAIYASDWAAATAIGHYGMDPSKVKVVPFGANIDSSPDLDGIRALLSHRSGKECHLLFLGVDWNRKGGMIALNTARKLNELGIRTYLHVVGIRSLPLQERPDYLIDHGFISKRTLEGRKRMEELLAQCHFLILPTRAEAYGLVICEANAFGMPSLASRTGGIPTIIKDGINGWMFPPEDNGDGYAERISEIWEDPDRYRVLCLSSYNEYRTRLNWDIAGKKIQSLLREI